MEDTEDEAIGLFQTLNRMVLRCSAHLATACDLYEQQSLYMGSCRQHQFYADIRACT